MKNNKVSFTLEDNDYAVVRPTQEQQKQGQFVYNTAFNDAINSGALLRKTLTKHMRNQGLWDDDKDTEHQDLMKAIVDDVRAIKNGGIKLLEAKELALRIGDNRSKVGDLLSDHTDLDLNTAEGQAEASRFNYLVSCTFLTGKTGEQVYKDVDTYIENSGDDEAIKAAESLAALMFDMDIDYKNKLPENEFLLKYDFVDEKLRLVDSDGHLVDRSGEKVNAQGYYVSEDGGFLDVEGNPVDEEGNWVYEDKPFLDEGGEPVDSGEEKIEVTEELEVAAT